MALRRLERLRVSASGRARGSRNSSKRFLGHKVYRCLDTNLSPGVAFDMLRQLAVITSYCVVTTMPKKSTRLTLAN